MLFIVVAKLTHNLLNKVANNYADSDLKQPFFA